MLLKINLEDERLCKGCYLDKTEIKCAAGFNRYEATLVEVKQKESPTQSFYKSMMFGMGNDEPKRVVLVKRPRECFLASEASVEAIKAVKTTEDVK